MERDVLIIFRTLKCCSAVPCGMRIFGDLACRPGMGRGLDPHFRAMKPPIKQRAATGLRSFRRKGSVIDTSTAA